MIRHIAKSISICFVLITFFANCTMAQDLKQQIGKDDLQWMTRALHTVRDEIQKNYYDPSFHGIDLNQRFLQAETKLANATNSNYGIADIAGAVSALNDSHTAFLPPGRPYTHDYGWRMEAEGADCCFVTAIRPGSDAEKKGLKPGDQILSVAGFQAVREDLWKIYYVYSILRPQPGLRIVVRSPGAEPRQLDIMATMTKKWEPWNFWEWEDAAQDAYDLHLPRSVEHGKDAIIYQLPDFLYNPDSSNEMLDKIRSHQALVLDLRGNPGGDVEFAERFLGGMFDHEVKIGTRVGRKPMRDALTKSRGGKTFQGKLIVLIDSQSASAAELFARVVQLEKRGAVIGDRSSGMVMESKLYPHLAPTTHGDIHYAVSITDANIIMADGKSLENVGVTPDEQIIPTAEDLATGRDPVLARAAKLAGIELTPEEAGKLFPARWPDERK
jgi:C-terminal processing protease CtpA/Prc